MKALLHINGSPEWPASLDSAAWPMLPVGNRPLLEYWFELCVELGIEDVKIVLNDFALEVEAYAGEGARWGLNISYGFERDDAAPLDYLRRTPEHWEDGLLHIRGPLFPARTEAYCSELVKEKLSGAFISEAGARLVVLRDSAEVAAYLKEAALPALATESGIDPIVMAAAKDLFDINQSLVMGENSRYLTAGYQMTADNCSIGANTVIPPTVKINPPVMIGDNCRIGEMTTIGPGAVIGNHVVIDNKTTLDHCIVLDGSYIGQSMEIQKKIIARSHLYDVEVEMGMDMPDPWLLSSTKQVRKGAETARAVLGWIYALMSVAIMLIPYAVLRLMLLGNKHTAEQFKPVGINGKKLNLRVIALPEHPGRRVKLFYRLALDRFPYFLQVLAGKLWLCGHSVVLKDESGALEKELPIYFPAAISYEDIQPEASRSEAMSRANAFFYLESRSVVEDLRMFFRFLIYRLFILWTQ